MADRITAREAKREVERDFGDIETRSFTTIEQDGHTLQVLFFRFEREGVERERYQVYIDGLPRFGEDFRAIR